MPQLGRKPNFAWVSPNLVSIVVKIMEQDSASSRAPVKQAPCTLAMTGNMELRNALAAAIPGSSKSSLILPATGVTPRNIFKSAPAEKLGRLLAE